MASASRIHLPLWVDLIVLLAVIGTGRILSAGPTRFGLSVSAYIALGGSLGFVAILFAILALIEIVRLWLSAEAGETKPPGQAN